MNFPKILFVLLLMALLSIACQLSGLLGSTTSTPISESTESYPAPELPAYPVEAYPYPPSDIYPYPVPEIPVVPSILYPDAKDGDEVSWEHAISMILNGEVTQVSQTHDLKVFLTLKDGRTLVTTQPVIDEVIKVIDKCGDKCRDIRIATE